MKKNKIMTLLISGALISTAMGASIVGTNNISTVKNKEMVTNNHILLAKSNYSITKTSCVINGNGSLVLTNKGGQTVSYISVGEMLNVHSTVGNKSLVTVKETGAKGYIDNSNILGIHNGDINNVSTMSKSGYIINVSNTVNFRVGPSMSDNVIMGLSNNTSVNILGKTNQWYKVSCNGHIGYIFNEYVGASTVNTTSNNDSKSVATSTSTVNTQGTTVAPASNVESHNVVNNTPVVNPSQGSASAHTTVAPVVNHNTESNKTSDTTHVVKPEVNSNVKHDTTNTTPVVKHDTTPVVKHETTPVVKHETTNTTPVVKHDTTPVKKNVVPVKPAAKTDSNTGKNTTPVAKPVVVPTVTKTPAYALQDVYLNPTPGVTQTHKALLLKGQKITLLGTENNGWFKAETQSGVQGYVGAKYISLTAPVAHKKVTPAKPVVIPTPVVKPEHHDTTPVVKPEHHDTTPVVVPVPAPVVKPDVVVPVPAPHHEVKPAPVQESPVYQAAESTQALNTINMWRQKEGLQPVALNSSMQAQAQLSAKKALETNNFTDGSFIPSSSLNTSDTAWGDGGFQPVMHAFYASEAHFKNLTIQLQNGSPVGVAVYTYKGQTCIKVISSALNINSTAKGWGQGTKPYTWN